MNCRVSEALRRYKSSDGNTVRIKLATVEVFNYNIEKPTINRTLIQC